MKRPTHRNRPHRARERGAVIFIVVMVMTLLAAIGVFSIRSASMVDMATGYARQSAQTQGLGLYGVPLAANELGDGRAQSISRIMDQRVEQCPSNGTVTNLPCKKVFSSELEQQVQSVAPSGVSMLEPQLPNHEGSLGPRHGISGETRGIEGNLMVEFFEQFQSPPPPGQDTRFGAREFTLNVWSQVRPVLNVASTDWCSADAASTSATVQAIRTYITVPGIQ